MFKQFMSEADQGNVTESAQRQAGFTIVELVVVIIILGDFIESITAFNFASDNFS